ncbi:MAG: DNA repair protein RecO [Solirubrobacterales bacterium]
MAQNFKTEAIVLRKLRYGEADSILHLYTREQGRVGAIAKGVRRSRSRFGGRLEPFFRLELILHEGRGDLATITSAETLDGYAQLRTRAESLDAAAKVGDFVLRLLDGRERNDPAYNLITTMLGLLDADPRAAGREVGLAFRAKMLLASGFSPELGSCVQCGTAEGLVAFSPPAGGLVCVDCRETGDFDFSSEAYVFMSGAIGAPLAEAPDASPEALRQTDRAITDTLAYHAQVRVRQLV